MTVRVEGPELAGFESPGADDHVRLFFPRGPFESSEGMRSSPSREYTPFAWGEDWLEIQFALHGAPGRRGVAAEWAATAELGAVVGIGGPRGSMLIEGQPDSWFLAGDETAVPAIRRFTAALAPQAVGSVVVEVRDAAHALGVPAPPGVKITHVHRGDEPAGRALARRLDVLSAADRPPGDVFAFIAAEQGVVRAGRALALDRWRLDPERIVVKGYWRLGDAAYHAPH